MIWFLSVELWNNKNFSHREKQKVKSSPPPFPTTFHLDRRLVFLMESFCSKCFFLYSISNKVGTVNKIFPFQNQICSLWGLQDHKRIQVCQMKYCWHSKKKSGHTTLFELLALMTTRIGSSTDGLSSLASIDSLDDETDTLKEEDDSSNVNSLSTAAAAIGGHCCYSNEGIEDIDSLGEIIEGDSDEENDDPEFFSEDQKGGQGETCLAYRAPWATPPKATQDSSGPGITSLCKLGNYACITSPPLSLRSPDLEEPPYPRCKHRQPNASWDTTRFEVWFMNSICWGKEYKSDT